MKNKITLFINTVKYLKLSQIFYRVLNKFKRELYKRKILSIKIPKEIKTKDDFDYLIPELDFDEEYLNRFDMDEILNDEFTFINLKHQVDLSTAWNNRKLQHLWRYNLHYFEYLYKIAYSFKNSDNQLLYYNKYKELINNWIENNPPGLGDGWHPYTISLRLTNWIATYQIFKEVAKGDTEFYRNFRESMYTQYRFLLNNIEKDVLGNHYFENIKALIICSIFFNDLRVKNKYKKELLIQLKEQILEDGMHFELSPMYHKIILENLINITYWLREEEIYDSLKFYIKKMIDVMYSFESDFGKTPAFNDSADGVSKHYKTLLKTCRKYFELTPLFRKSFEDSGYYIISNENAKLIFDTGEICPTYLPAHGHCDALSFELSTNGVPIFVNSGTYQYESGQWRNYFRNTKAHSTVCISNNEQSQCWSSFRIAKRIKDVRRKHFHINNIPYYAGSYQSQNGEVHKRFIGDLAENAIIVLDFVKPHSNENIQSYLHLVPEASVNTSEGIIHVLTNRESIKIYPIGIADISVNKGWYSEQFNKKEVNSHIVFQKNKESNYFGYIIIFNSANYKIVELEDRLKIIGDKKITIDYEELGVML